MFSTEAKKDHQAATVRDSDTPGFGCGCDVIFSPDGCMAAATIQISLQVGLHSPDQSTMHRRRVTKRATAAVGPCLRPVFVRILSRVGAV